TIGDKFITEAGYNAWADSNRLIVLYPQTRQIPNNPNSCWDWWGYSSYRYHVKDAPQIEAIQAMIERLTSR
ncbi:MAG: poly(3-hydroxybutyrate) depolymerase, partial [Zoogloeaceae bacterium]|nr:poly(3-hydroxybutyrate) depolymerase [Zoogloeaceae bacterium]